MLIKGRNKMTVNANYTDLEVYQYYLEKLQVSINKRLILFSVMLAGVGYLLYVTISSFPNELMMIIWSILLIILLISILSSLFDLKRIKDLIQNPLHDLKGTEENLKLLFKKYHPDHLVNQFLDVNVMLEYNQQLSISDKQSDFECIQQAYQAFLRIKTHDK
jgi:hypothetical protein